MAGKSEQTTWVIPGDQAGTYDWEVTYDTLNQVVIHSEAGIDNLSRQLKLMLKNGVSPLVTVAEPRHKRRVNYERPEH